jgi:hypothetical protein
MREVHVLSLGAGVQSTTLYLMRDYDVAIFADTQEEPEAVYAHLEWLKSLNRTPILVRSKGKLGDDLLQWRNSTGQRYSSIPAYRLAQDGGIGAGRRQCSKEYKLEVINQTLRREVLGLRPKQRLPKDVEIHQYIGISLDEGGRAKRISAFPRPSQVQLHFPLLEALWTRADCQRYLAGMVPHKVPRSACVFCPYHSDAEWLEIKERPAEWRRAVEIDEAIRHHHKLDGTVFLHERCEPLVQIKFDASPDPRAAQLSFRMARECFGVCGV